MQNLVRTYGQATELYGSYRPTVPVIPTGSVVGGAKTSVMVRGPKMSQGIGVLAVAERRAATTAATTAAEAVRRLSSFMG